MPLREGHSSGNMPERCSSCSFKSYILGPLGVSSCYAGVRHAANRLYLSASLKDVRTPGKFMGEFYMKN